MKLFDFLFHKSDPPQVPGGQPKSSTYSERDMKTIGDMARRCAEIINESLQIVQNSQDAETKVSRLSVAKEKLQEAKQLARQYPFVRLTSLFEVEGDITRDGTRFAEPGKELVLGLVGV